MVHVMYFKRMLISGFCLCKTGSFGCEVCTTLVDDPLPTTLFGANKIQLLLAL
jgi:hypothetical protein